MLFSTDEIEPPRNFIFNFVIVSYSTLDLQSSLALDKGSNFFEEEQQQQKNRYLLKDNNNDCENFNGSKSLLLLLPCLFCSSGKIDNKRMIDAFEKVKGRNASICHIIQIYSIKQHFLHSSSTAAASKRLRKEVLSFGGGQSCLMLV